MDEITKQFSLRALDRRIKDLTKYIEWQNNIVKQSERELRTKTGSTMDTPLGGVQFEFYEDTSTKLLQEATVRRDNATANLEKYKHARESIENMGGLQ